MYILCASLVEVVIKYYHKHSCLQLAEMQHFMHQEIQGDFPGTGKLFSAGEDKDKDLVNSIPFFLCQYFLL